MNSIQRNIKIGIEVLNWVDNIGTNMHIEPPNEGRDVWEIEMNGGPQIECDSCPDYTYEDQVVYFWPASIAGIQAYTSQDSIDYIGHSNGGRVALSSLNSYSSGKSNAGYFFNYTTGTYDLTDLESNPVDKLIVVAAPGLLTEGSTFVDTARLDIIPFVGPKLGNVVISNLINKQHITMFDFASKALAIETINPLMISLKPDIVFLASIFVGNNKISKNLISYYKDVALEENSTLDLSGVDVNEMQLYYSNFLFFGHDILVPFEDMDNIYDSTTSIDVADKYKNEGSWRLHHSSITNNRNIKDKIKEDLK